MSSPRQDDLFRNDDAAEEGETPTWYPDPDEVRAELHAILGQDEGAQLRFDFETELARLEAA